MCQTISWTESSNFLDSLRCPFQALLAPARNCYTQALNWCPCSSQTRQQASRSLHQKVKMFQDGQDELSKINKCFFKLVFPSHFWMECLLMHPNKLSQKGKIILMELWRSEVMLVEDSFKVNLTIFIAAIFVLFETLSGRHFLQSLVGPQPATYQSLPLSWGDYHSYNVSPNSHLSHFLEAETMSLLPG